VRDFLLQAVRIPLLRAEQEVGLAQLIEVGKHAQARIDAAKSMSVALHPVLRGQFAAAVRHGELARKYFVEANLLLAADRAMRYQGRGMELGDLIQEASIGLIRAVENFDYTLGYKFSTYATIVINSLILSGIANKARLIRLPVHIQTGSLHELAVARLHLSSESSHEPTVKEIAKYMGKDEETVEQLISYSRQPISLSLTDDDESDRTVEDYLASHDVGSDPQAAVNSMANADILRQAIAKLPALERYVIVREFGLLGNDAECLESISERTGRKLRVLKDAELRAIDQLKSDGVISHLLAD
jgi:RNA polymerase primary sigma factor